MSLLSAAFDWAATGWGATRDLQGITFPNYTSPATDYALACTPSPYRSDKVIDSGRQAARAGLCDADKCQIIFRPAQSSSNNKRLLRRNTKDSTEEDESIESTSNQREIKTQSNNGAKVGVVFFGGAFVDPRAYSPIAKQLADDYGLPVVIPIFDHDFGLPFGRCSTGRLSLAAEAFPDVEKWIVGGHSLGGVVAQIDVQAAFLARDDSVDGLFMLGSYLSRSNGLPPVCGSPDFSDSSMPMALVYASEDGSLDPSLATSTLDLYSEKPLVMNVIGGNHRQFGSYNDTLRSEFVPRNPPDGIPFIPEKLQHDMSVTAIVHVASRTGVEIPKLN